jgi:hypothetical protein
MRHLRWAVLAVVAVGLCAAPVAVAHEQGEGGGAVVSPVHKVAGLTGGELLGEAWVQLLSHPADTFAGACMPVGRKVLSPEPGPDLTATCTVERGTPLLFWFGSDCSNVESPPFFGGDEAAQRACAVAADEFFVAANITVDNGEPVDFRNPRFELISPQRTVELAADNFLGVPPQTATFVAHGWAALVRKLRLGDHTIAVEVTDVDGVTSTFVASIHVVPRAHDRDDDGDDGDHHDDDDDNSDDD